jgi:CRP-like cAMP-binding protein
LLISLLFFMRSDNQTWNIFNKCAYLRSGLAKVHIAGPYHEQIVRIVKTPSYLGLPTTFGDKINQYSVTVIEKAEVCFIDISTFRFLLGINPDFLDEIMIELCRNELEVFTRCANRTQKQVRGKIADVLLEMSDHIYNSEIFIIPLNHEDVGNLIDSSRESVSRVLAEFEKDGIIRISGKNIEILNKKSLLMISPNGRFFCRPGGNRTLDPMIKSHVLCQLSYGPVILKIKIN